MNAHSTMACCALTVVRLWAGASKGRTMFHRVGQAVGRFGASQGVLVEGLGPVTSPFGPGATAFAVDGVCLTVAELHSDGFRADVPARSPQPAAPWHQGGLHGAPG